MIIDNQMNTITATTDPVTVMDSSINNLGYISFSNVMFVLSILMIILGTIWLCGIHMINILKLIQLQTLEILLYAGFIFLIYHTPHWFGSLAYIWGLLFALGLSATTLISSTIRHSATTSIEYLLITNIAIHSITGIYLQSPQICGIAVVFFMNLIGFRIGFGPGYWAFGYDEHDNSIIYSATYASGLVLGLGAMIRINGLGANPSIAMKNAELFVPGALWIGPFVFFTSLLIISSLRFDKSQYNRRYINNNIFAIACYIFALYIGNIYSINQLSGYAGTIFVLYLMEKYIEIMPNRSEVWASSILALGIILYIVNIHYRMEIERTGLYDYFHIPFFGI